MHPDQVWRLYELHSRELEQKLATARLIANGAPERDSAMRERIALLLCAVAERLAPKSQPQAAFSEQRCVACA